jgi:hypothetical protein
MDRKCIEEGYRASAVLQGRGFQIWVCRPGALPLDPAKELFEKSSLESQKLSKMYI